MTSGLPDVLFHVTSKRVARNLGIHGLPPGTPWVRSDVAAYHARLLSQAGHAPLVLSLPVGELAGLKPLPDWKAIQAPPLDVLERHSEAVSAQWTHGDPTWERSVEVVGSMVCGLPLPAPYLKKHMPATVFR